MTEIPSEQLNNSSLSLNYINLLNNLFLSFQSNPLQSLEVLSNESFLYSLIIEVEPNIENILSTNLILNTEDMNIKSNNFILILTSIENYCNENKSKDQFKEKAMFTKNISVEKIINKDQSEIIKLVEMLVFLSMICSNKNYYIEKMNKVEDNTINKLYYSIIENYIDFKIEKSPDSNISIKPIVINGDNPIFNGKNIIVSDYLIKGFGGDRIKLDEKNNIDNINNEIIELKQKLEKCEQEKLILEQKLKDNNITISKEFNNNLIIEKQENISKEILSTQNINNNNINKEEDDDSFIENLKNENEDLHRTIDNLCIEKQELEALVDKLNTNIKELELDYQKLKEEYDIKEQSSSEMIFNNKSMIEKLNHDLKLEIKLNQKYTEEKELLEKELNKYNENLDEILNMKKTLGEKEEEIKKLIEKNEEYEKEKRKENNYYKKSYEEQKIRVNEEHKLISESLYRLAIHFMTLKDDLQNRINSAKNNNK